MATPTPAAAPAAPATPGLFSKLFGSSEASPSKAPAQTPVETKTAEVAVPVLTAPPAAVTPPPAPAAISKPVTPVSEKALSEWGTEVDKVINAVRAWNKKVPQNQVNKFTILLTAAETLQTKLVEEKTLRASQEEKIKDLNDSLVAKMKELEAAQAAMKAKIEESNVAFTALTDLNAKLKTSDEALKAALDQIKSTPSLKGPVIFEASKEVKAIAGHVAALKSLEESVSTRNKAYQTTPDKGPEFAALKKDIADCSIAYNAIMKAVEDESKAVAEFFAGLGAHIKETTKHILTERSEATAAMHVGMEIADYKAKLVGAFAEALKKNNDLKASVMKDYNGLLALLATVSQDVALLEKGLTNNGKPAWGWFDLKAVCSKSAQYLYEGKDFTLKV